MNIRILVAFQIALFLLVLRPCFALAQDAGPPGIDETKRFFATLISLGDNYDARYADLFSDTARIQNTRRYPDGKTRVAKLTGSQYKVMIAQALPVAKSVRDRSSYSKVSFSTEGQGVRIQATRYAERKKYYSPISFLVVREGRELKIVEEISESQP